MNNFTPSYEQQQVKSTDEADDANDVTKGKTEEPDTVKALVMIQFEEYRCQKDEMFTIFGVSPENALGTTIEMSVHWVLGHGIRAGRTPLRPVIGHEGRVVWKCSFTVDNFRVPTKRTAGAVCPGNIMGSDGGEADPARTAASLFVKLHRTKTQSEKDADGARPAGEGPPSDVVCIGESIVPLVYKRKARYTLHMADARPEESGATAPAPPTARGVLVLMCGMQCADLDEIRSQATAVTSVASYGHRNTFDNDCAEARALRRALEAEERQRECIFCHEEFDPEDPKVTYCTGHKQEPVRQWRYAAGVIGGAALAGMVGGGLLGIGLIALKFHSAHVAVAAYSSSGFTVGAVAGTALTAAGAVDIHRYACCGKCVGDPECNEYTEHVDKERASMLLRASQGALEVWEADGLEEERAKKEGRVRNKYKYQ
eukprot:PhM_4_TR14817/c0_g1_i1/m.33752